MVSCVSNSENENLIHNEDFKDSSNINSTTIIDSSISESTDFLLNKDSIYILDSIDTLNEISIKELLIKIIDNDTLFYLKEMLFTGKTSDTESNTKTTTTFINGYKTHLKKYEMADLIYEAKFKYGLLSNYSTYSFPEGEIMSEFNRVVNENRSIGDSSLIYHPFEGSSKEEYYWSNGIKTITKHICDWQTHGPPEDVEDYYSGITYSLKNGKLHGVKNLFGQYKLVYEDGVITKTIFINEDYNGDFDETAEDIGC